MLSLEEAVVNSGLGALRKWSIGYFGVSWRWED